MRVLCEKMDKALSDNLLAGAGLIFEELAGQIQALDYDPQEKAGRVTINADFAINTQTNLPLISLQLCSLLYYPKFARCCQVKIYYRKLHAPFIKTPLRTQVSIHQIIKPRIQLAKLGIIIINNWRAIQSLGGVRPFGPCLK